MRYVFLSLTLRRSKASISRRFSCPGSSQTDLCSERQTEWAALSSNSCHAQCPRRRRDTVPTSPATLLGFPFPEPLARPPDPCRDQQSRPPRPGWALSLALPLVSFRNDETPAILESLLFPSHFPVPIPLARHSPSSGPAPFLSFEPPPRHSLAPTSPPPPSLSTESHSILWLCAAATDDHRAAHRRRRNRLSASQSLRWVSQVPDCHSLPSLPTA